MKRIWADPEERKRRSEANKRGWNRERRKRKSEAMKLIWADPEVHQRWSEVNKRSAADPEVRKRMSEANKRTAADPEVRKRKSKATKQNWKNPQVRESRIEGNKHALANPEYRKRLSEANKLAWDNPERRELASERIKGSWKDPKVRKRRIKGMKRTYSSSEAKKRRGEASKRVWAKRREILAEAKQFVEASRAAQSVIAKRSRGRKKGELLEDTPARITIAAYMTSQGATKRAIAAEMYPLHGRRADAWNVAKNSIFKRYGEKIKQEQSRLAGLPAMGMAAFEAAKSKLARP